MLPKRQMLALLGRDAACRCPERGQLRACDQEGEDAQHNRHDQVWQFSRVGISHALRLRELGALRHRARSGSCENEVLAEHDRKDVARGIERLN